MYPTIFTYLRTLATAAAGVAISLSCWSNSVQAVDFKWANPAGGAFSAPANWSPLGVPGAGDNALFSVDDRYSVDFNAPQTSNNLVLSAGDLTLRPINSVAYTIVNATDIDGGTLTLTRGTGGETLTYNGGDLFVGDRERGSLNIFDGAIVSSNIATIGNNAPNGVGTALVRGTGSTWNSSESMTIGNRGFATLAVESGGSVTSQLGAIIGAFAGSSGEAVIRDAGSIWDSFGFVIGNSGQGRLSIENGGTASSIVSNIGDNAGSFGVVNVRGAGSVWGHTHELRVGTAGSGELTVSDGGAVSNLDGFLANSAGSDGRATVTGAGSLWTNTGQLHVGRAGSATLDILDGGIITSASGIIGQFQGGVGFVTVDGEGSFWDVAGDLTIGGEGLALLTLTDQGHVSVGGQVLVNSLAQIRLFGGKLSVPTLNTDVMAALNWQSGALHLTDAAGLDIGAGGLLGDSLALNARQSLELGGPMTIEPGGSFTGGGGLSATAIHVQPGSHFALVGTTVHGPVNSPAGAALNIIGDVTFNDLVSGGGDFFGSGTAIFNGGHSPGDSPAVVPVEGNLSYGSSNLLTIELEGRLLGEFDRLEVQGDVSLDGSLAIEFLSDFAPSFGDQFEIIDVGGTLSGQFIGLGEGALIDLGTGTPLRLTYAGGDGNDVVFNAVPEPGSSAAALLALVSVILGRPATRRPKLA